MSDTAATAPPLNQFDAIIAKVLGRAWLDADTITRCLAVRYREHNDDAAILTALARLVAAGVARVDEREGVRQWQAAK